MQEETYVDHRVRIWHHSDEEVQQYDHVDHWVRPEHQQTPESGVGFDSGEFETAEVHHAKTSPKKRLRRFKHATIVKMWSKFRFSLVVLGKTSPFHASVSSSIEIRLAGW